MRRVIIDTDVASPSIKQQLPPALLRELLGAGAMLTVETDPASVEERLGSGGLACPGCAGVLAGWGRARARTVRGPDGGIPIAPRLSRCTGCRTTHVLVPVLLPVRRARMSCRMSLRRRGP